jgi:hypothetical protein
VKTWVTAIAGAYGIEMVEPGFTIYPEISEAAIERVSQTNGDNLFMFRTEEELMPLRSRRGMAPEIIG